MKKCFQKINVKLENVAGLLLKINILGDKGS